MHFKDSVAGRKKQNLRWQIRIRLRKIERTASGRARRRRRHTKDIELSLMPLAAVNVAARALPPQTNRRPMTKGRGTR